MPSALFDRLFLYFCDSPAIGNMVGGRTQSVCCLSDSRLQLIYRIAYGLAEVVQLLSIHSPVKGSTYISTGQPEPDVTLFVGHRVLTNRESGTPQRSR